MRVTGHGAYDLPGRCCLPSQTPLEGIRDEARGLASSESFTTSHVSLSVTGLREQREHSGQKHRRLQNQPDEINTSGCSDQGPGWCELSERAAAVGTLNSSSTSTFSALILDSRVRSTNQPLES